MHRSVWCVCAGLGEPSRGNSREQPQKEPFLPLRENPKICDERVC